MDELKRRQEASQRVEQRMLRAMYDDPACQDLKLREVRGLASIARFIAFEEFSKDAPAA